MFVAFPLWFGEFLHRKSLLQVSLMCCGLCWTSFSLSSIDKHASLPTSPSLQVWCMSSKFLHSYAISICKISNAKRNFRFSFDLHPKSRTYGATGCPDVHPFFCSLLYFLLEFAVLIHVIVWPAQTSVRCWWPARNSAGQSQLAGSHPVFRNSFSVERLWSLFVDCGCRFKRKKKNKKPLPVRVSFVPPHSKCTNLQAVIYSLWLFSFVCN